MRHLLRSECSRNPLLFIPTLGALDLAVRWGISKGAVDKAVEVGEGEERLVVVDRRHAECFEKSWKSLKIKSCS